MSDISSPAAPPAPAAAPGNALPRRTAELPAHPPRSVIARFRDTKPWTRIVAVSGLTWSALILVVALFLLVRALSLRGQPLLVGLAAGLVIIAIVYALPAMALMRYSRSMEAAIRNPSIASVETALRQHKTFWMVAVTLAMLGMAMQIYQMTTTIFVPNLRSALDRAKQKRTIADVKTIGEALERYAKEHNVYPRARSNDELRTLLVPRYTATLPLKDGWGRDLIYVTRCGEEGCFDAAIISAGSDGVRQGLNPDQVFGLAALPDQPAEPPKIAPWEAPPASRPQETEKKKESPFADADKDKWNREHDVMWANGRMLQPKPEAK